MKKFHHSVQCPEACAEAGCKGPVLRLLAGLWRGSDVGLAFLRGGIGILMAVWGLDKVLNYSKYVETFPDPVGLGREVSLGLTIVAQVPCSAFVIVGWFTRLFAVPPLVCMLVAALIVHRSDPWSYTEHALLYAIPFAAILLMGPGKVSVDAAVSRGGAQRVRSSQANPP